MSGPGPGSTAPAEPEASPSDLSREPRRTALHPRHRELGARFTDFGGWEMPVRYGSIIEEHTATRTGAGLFDLSHMGELWVAGSGAADALAVALVSDPGRLAVGRAQYSLICQTDGGIVDDLIVYRVTESRFLVVPNAGNAAAVAAELAERLGGHPAEVRAATLETSLVAIQGPTAAGILEPLTDVRLGDLRNYAAAEGRVAGRPALVARTGYTGEDGFELFVGWDDGPAVWDALLEAGAPAGGLRPCGLGARDTLRLEAGMPLYGNELDRDTNPYEAGLGRVVKLDKPVDFIGRAALEAASRAPLRRELVGLGGRGPGIPRHGHPVRRAGEHEPVGVVTSGSHSPTLGAAIAMAYVPPSEAAPGTMLDVAVRETAVPAEVAALPFYRRPR
ncbi:glycine cleavage system aminomethyltransferase GcvT [soil metagenome]